MRIATKLLASLLALIALGTAPAGAAPGDEAAGHYRDGMEVLTRGDFDGAIQALLRAAQADPRNQEYRQELALVHRIRQIRGLMESEKDLQAWARHARSVRAFYYEYEIYGEALALDRQRHQRIGTVATAVSLAESQLELDRNAEAAELLGKIADEKATPRALTLRGIAVARLGKLEEARALARRCPAPEGKDRALIFHMACLRALTDDLPGAADLLTLCFESIPPSQLEAAKAYAKGRRDLAALTASPDYAKVWLTASKIAESSCSGGTSCGSCPSKGSCGSAQGEGGCEEGEHAGGGGE